LTLFFDLPIEQALSRTDSRRDAGERKNRMDRETIGFYERVRAAYLTIAGDEPDRFRIVDASGTTGEIKTIVMEIVSEFLDNS
jgi:dTMP kinase